MIRVTVLSIKNYAWLPLDAVIENKSNSYHAQHYSVDVDVMPEICSVERKDGIIAIACQGNRRLQARDSPPAFLR